MRAMNLPTDMLATSGGWDTKKPDPAFFDRIVAESGFRPHETVYVGDRIDNDVVPAAATGLVPVHLVRGPWGYLQKDWHEARQARARLTTLDELPELVKRLQNIGLTGQEI